MAVITEEHELNHYVELKNTCQTCFPRCFKNVSTRVFVVTCMHVLMAFNSIVYKYVIL